MLAMPELKSDLQQWVRAASTKIDDWPGTSALFGWSVTGELLKPTTQFWLNVFDI
jgi:hypothetical protein